MNDQETAPPPPPCVCVCVCEGAVSEVGFVSQVSDPRCRGFHVKGGGGGGVVPCCILFIGSLHPILQSVRITDLNAESVPWCTV